METTLIKKILEYLPGTIIPSVLTLLSLKVFSIYLSIEEFGLFNYWLTLALLVSSVFSQWISQPMLRYTTDKSITYQNEVISFFIIIIGMVLSLLLLFAKLFFEGENKILYMLVIILIFLFTSIQIIYTKLQVNFQIKKYSFLKLAESSAKVLLPILGIFAFVSNTNTIFISIITGMIVILIINYKILFPKFHLDKNLFRNKEFLNTQKNYFSFGLPMVIWFSVNGIMSFADRFLLKKFSGYDSVAIYSANYSLITGSVALITAPLLMIAHPMLMSRWNDSKKRETGDLLSYFIEIFMLFSFLLIALTFLNRDLITLVFLNEKFREGNVIMPLILIGFIIWQLGMLFHKPIEFEESIKKMVSAMFVACAVNIILNMILIPKFSYVGASISSIVSYTVYAFIVFKLGNKIMSYEFVGKKGVAKNVILLIVILFTGLVMDKLNLKIDRIVINIFMSLIYLVLYIKINLKRLTKLLKVIK